MFNTLNYSKVDILETLNYSFSQDSSFFLWEFSLLYLLSVTPPIWLTA